MAGKKVSGKQRVSERLERRPEPEKVRVMLLGEEGVGKTAMVTRMSKDEFTTDYVPTGPSHEFHVVHKIYSKTESALFEILDSGNQSDYVFLPQHRDLFILHTDCFVFCFNITDPASFKKIDKYYGLIPELYHHCPNPVMLVGCKLDLRKDRQVPKKTALAKAEFLGCGYMEVTSHHGKSVEALFELIMDKVIFYRAQLKKAEKAIKPSSSFSARLSRMLSMENLGKIAK